jgi:hypothetical protein
MMNMEKKKGEGKNTNMEPKSIGKNSNSGVENMGSL